VRNVLYQLPMGITIYCCEFCTNCSSVCGNSFVKTHFEFNRHLDVDCGKVVSNLAIQLKIYLSHSEQSDCLTVNEFVAECKLLWIGRIPIFEVAKMLSKVDIVAMCIRYSELTEISFVKSTKLPRCDMTVTRL